MTRAFYLSRHSGLVQRMKNAGIPYPRRVWWQLPAKCASLYAVQLRSMREALAGFLES